jgi:hypothetical protein
MPKRKLTEKLKSQIRQDYSRLKQSDFEGEALAYLKQVRGAHKGLERQKEIRKERSEKVKEKYIPHASQPKDRKPKITIEGNEILPGSLAYEIIEASARNKKQTVKKFVAENRETIGKMLRDYLIFHRKEIDDLRELINSLPSGSKIFSPIKRKVISAVTAHMILHMIKKTLIDTCGVYPYIFIEYAFDLEANLHFNCPRPGEYAKFEDCEELQEFLEDRYPNIEWIEHTETK